MDIERACEINGKLCNAWFVLAGILRGPLPSLHGITVESAREATQLVRQTNDCAMQEGGNVFVTTIDERALARLFRDAVLATQL
jgi:hypothetical protein